MNVTRFPKVNVENINCFNYMSKNIDYREKVSNQSDGKCYLFFNYVSKNNNHREKVSNKSDRKLSTKEDLDKAIQRHICGGCLKNLKGIYNYKCKILTTEEQIVKYFHDNKVPPRSKVDLNRLIKEEDQIEDISNSLDNTYESLVNLIDTSRSKDEMCFYKQTIYKCFMCDFASVNCNSLTEHYRNIHNKRVQISMEDIPQEKEEENKENLFVCEFPYCDFTTAKQYNMCSHKSSHLKNFACSKCGSRHANVQAVARHIANHNEANIAVKCTLCGYKTANMSFARKHYFTDHKDCDVNQDTDIKVDRNGNDCDIKTLCDDLSLMLDSFEADKLGEEIMSLNTGKSSQKSSEIFSCKQCSYTASTLSSLVHHESSIHSKKRRRNSTTSVETHDSSATGRSNSSSSRKTRNTPVNEEKKVKSENDSTAQMPSYKCDLCSYTHTSKISVEMHRVSKHFKNQIFISSKDRVIKPKLSARIKSANMKVKRKLSPDKKSTETKENKQEEKKKGKTSPSATTAESSEVKEPEAKIKKINRKHIFGCIYCSLGYTSIEKFNDHFSSNHSDRTLYFKCGLCSWRSLFKHKLKSHHTSVHAIKWKPTSKPDEKCISKPDESSNKEKKDAKQKTKRDKPAKVRKIYIMVDKNRPGHGKFRCPHCPYITDYYKKFMQHWLIHSKPYCCGYCGHASAEVRTIRNHVQSQHMGCSLQIQCTFNRCAFGTVNATEAGRHFSEVHRFTKEFLREFYDEYQSLRRRLDANSPIKKRVDANYSVKKSKSNDISIVLTKLDDMGNTANTNTSEPAGSGRQETGGSNTPPPVLTKQEPIQLDYEHNVNVKMESLDNEFAEVDASEADNEELLETSGEATEELNELDPLGETESDPVCDNEVNNDVDVDTYNCPHCTEKFNSLEDLDDHAKMHVGPEENQNVFCGFKPSENAELKKRYASDHALDEGKDKNFASVDGKIDSKEQVREQILRNDSQPMQGNEVIEIQDDVFSEEAEEAMDTEMQNSSENHVQETLHVCNICGFSVDNEELMTSHKKQHNIENPFVCVVCDQSFTEGLALKEHFNSTHKKDTSSAEEVRADDPENSEELKYDDLLATVKYSCEKCSYRTVDDEKMRIHHQKCKRKLADKERQLRLCKKNVDPYEPKITSYKTVTNRSDSDEPNSTIEAEDSVTEEKQNESNNIDQNIICLEEMEDSLNSNNLDEKTGETMEVEGNRANEKDDEPSMAPVEMVDPFESDSEDYCKTLEDAIACMNIPMPNKESEEAVNDEKVMNDNEEKIETVDETVKRTTLEDLVIIDDDD